MVLEQIPLWTFSPVDIIQLRSAKMELHNICVSGQTKFGVHAVNTKLDTLVGVPLPTPNSAPHDNYYFRNLPRKVT